MPGKLLSILLLSAAVTSGGAFQPTPPPTMLRLRGTIEKFEPSTRTLSVSTSNGTVRLRLADTTRVRQSGRAIDMATLEKLSGFRADVHYSEVEGQRTVESVHVGGKAKG
jgi:hypothetical protein